ncbi:MAG TPA: tyrosine-type recombinase/integrase [Ferruginibacter sp.]|nr:tyrosine-type recombinase/integrase [Ferruginibacter sp.]HRO06158.1 tyrosine-type recombinase/integrase [Ferruginibacter sp.]HRO96551.1 tyrosine-type recombinase/integrase [Ferruginibacter sp.]HRP49717.1 tyrosine-type recombinase/integrase [Ferruginibacter sp.]
MPLTPETSIPSFLHYLRFQKRYAQHTLLAYTHDLNSFEQYLKETYPDEVPAKAAPVMIRSWLASMRESGIQARTVNRKISALKSFYKYLMREQLIEVSPMTAILTPKVKKRLPQYVEKQDMDRLFQDDVFPKDFKGQTERVILKILYATGIRRSELLNLKEQHIDFSNQTIKVLGKGSKERLIPVSATLLALLQEYRELKKQLNEAADREYLLVNEKGKRLHSGFIYSTVKRYLSTVTTIQRRSPHILRHTFATHLTGNGADLNAVKELLGHSSLAATQVYTHNHIEKLKEIHKKAHPKS